MRPAKKRPFVPFPRVTPMGIGRNSEPIDNGGKLSPMKGGTPLPQKHPLKAPNGHTQLGTVHYIKP